MKFVRWGRRYRGMPLTAAVLAVLTLIPALPAAGVTLFHIRGTVSDALGRPLEGVSVSDGVNPAVTTLADGTYELPESSTGTYSVVASRSDLDTSPPRTVNASIPLSVTGVDFTMKYKISGSMSGSSMSTASGPQHRTLNVLTRAPSPGSPGGTAGTSCVYVLDSRTGQTNPADYVSTTSGQSTWAFGISLAQNATEGNFTLSYEAKDCSTSVSMTGKPSTSYVVDNTAPKLNMGILFPADSGNTLAVPQPIIAKLTDARTSVSLSSLSIELENLAANTMQTFAGTSQLTYSSSTGIVKTKTSVPLAAGTRYEVRLSGSDAVGNAMTETWNFRTISVNPTAAKSQMLGTTGTFVGSQTSNKWEFVPALDVGQHKVSFTQSEHSGYGNITHTVPLSTATITYEIAGVASPSTISPYVTGTTATVQSEYVILADDGVATREVLGTQVKLQPLTVDLPLGAGNPKLTMSPIDSIPTLPATGCTDPTTGPSGCTSDPLRFWLAEDFASESYASADAPTVADQPIPGPNGPVIPPMIANLLNFTCVTTWGDDGTWAATPPKCVTVNGIPPHWEPLFPGQSVATVNGTQYIAGIGYPGTMPPRVPEQYAGACSIGYPCVSNRAAATGTASPGYYGASASASAPTYGNDDVRKKCVLIDGHNRPNKNCQQTVLLGMRPPHKSGTQKLHTYWLTQVGTMDDVQGEAPDDEQIRPYPNDGLGLSWYNDAHAQDVTAKWHFHNNANQWRSVVQQGYYHYEGDIAQYTGAPNWGRSKIPPHRLNWTYHSMGGQNSIRWEQSVDTSANNRGWGYALAFPYSQTNPTHNNGYGAEIADTSVQYQSSCGTVLNRQVNPYTGKYCSSSDGGTGMFSGYYNPDSGYFQRLREGTSRATAYYLEGEVRGDNPSEMGWAVVRWGHIYSEYNVEWSAGWGVSFPGGWGFGLSMTPKNEQKSKTSEFAYRYCYGSSSC